MKVFSISENGLVEESTLDLEKKFDNRGFTQFVYLVQYWDHNCIVVRESYGSGAVERTFYLNRATADIEAAKAKHALAETLRAKIAELQKQLKELE